MIRPGLYAIADTATLGAEALEPAVAAALAGGATLVQYRDKGDDTQRRRRQAAHLARLCRARGVRLIVNDDVELAAGVAADGVHVGGDDAAPEVARHRLGPGAIVGVSCYASLERARRARAAGADYIAFGRVYASSTKASSVRAPLSLLRQARDETGLAVCAIGGITAERAPEVVAAGADLVAVIGDLWDSPDVEERARRFAAAFAEGAAP